MIDYEKTRKAFTGKPKKQRSFSLSEETDAAWRDFVETYSNTEIRRGNGIASVMTEISLRIAMAIITGFEIETIAPLLKSILPGEEAIKKVKRNLLDITNKM